MIFKHHGLGLVDKLALGIALVVTIASGNVVSAEAAKSPPQSNRLKIVAVEGNAPRVDGDSKPFHAIDGDLSTAWQARGSKGTVDLTLDLGTVQQVDEVWIAFAHDRTYEFDVRGSYTGQGGWVIPVSAQSHAKAGSWKRVVLPTHKKRRYFRIKSHGTTDADATNRFDVAEIVLIGRQINEPVAPAAQGEPRQVTIAWQEDGHQRSINGEAVFASPLSGLFAMYGKIEQAEASLRPVRVEDGPSGEPAQVLRFRSQKKTGQAAALAFQARSAHAVQAGEMLLVSFWARSVQSASESGSGEAGVGIGQFKKRWRPYIQYPLLLPDQWRRYHVYGKILNAEDAGDLRLWIDVGGWPQTLEFADFRVANLGRNVNIDTLPQIEANYDYDGRDAEAAWRREAQQRIEKHRMAELTVRVVDSQGKPVPEASVHVAMQKHAFKFGSLVSHEILSGYRMPRPDEPLQWQPVDQSDLTKYRQIVEQYFNEVTVGAHPVNWINMNRSESERSEHWMFWGGRRESFDRILQWLSERQITVRGHSLCWGTPRGENADMTSRIINTLARERLEATRGLIQEWDAVNHPVSTWPLDRIRNHFAEHGEHLEDTIRIMKIARQANPDALLYANEGQLLPSGKSIPAYEYFIELMAERGVQFDGIGFMGHFAPGSLTPIATIYDRLDRLARFDVPLKITELDVTLPFAEQSQADYLRDVLTIAFSHPRVEGVIMWGFWEGRHWKPEAALWRKDWTIKPAGQAFVDLVRGQWWTDRNLRTNEAGEATVRGFLGDYRITCQAQERSATASLTLDGKRQTITLTLEQATR